MSNRYKGAVISATPPTTSTTSAVGVWSLRQQMQAIAADVWPGLNTTFTANANTQINPSKTGPISLATFNENKVIAAYYYNDGNIRTQILDVNGTAVSTNAHTTISNSVYNISPIVVLTSTTALLVYEESTYNAGTDDYNQYLKAVVLSVSGTTITVNTPVTLESVLNTNSGIISTSNLGLATLSSGTAVYCYRDRINNALYAIAMTISGTTITAGSKTLIQTSAYNDAITAAAITPTSLIAGYKGGNGDPFVVVITVSGTTLTIGTAQNINNSNCDFNIVYKLTSNTAIAAYNAGSLLYTVVLSISGTTVTTNTRAQVTGSQLNNVRICMNTPTKGVICYVDPNNSAKTAAQEIFVQNTTISFGSTITDIASGTTRPVNDYVGISPLTTSTTIIGYSQENSGSYGAGVALVLSGIFNQ